MGFKITLVKSNIIIDDIYILQKLNTSYNNMANYQQLTSYTGDLYGTPQYRGIEYDYEVPTNLVVASPGGVSTIHHHWTKGFDGRGNSSSDVYAGQGPQYISGNYGNMYQQGQTSTEAYYPAPPDYQFWQNQQPSQTFVPQIDIAYDDKNKIADSSMRLYPGDQIPNKEAFELVDLSEPGRTNYDVLVLFGLGLLLFIVLCMWTKTLDLFIQSINKGPINWKTSGIYAFVFTLLLGILAWFKYN